MDVVVETDDIEHDVRALGDEDLANETEGGKQGVNEAKTKARERDAPEAHVAHDSRVVVVRADVGVFDGDLGDNVDGREQTD